MMSYWGSPHDLFKTAGQGTRRKRAFPFMSRLPFGQILKEGSESKNSRKSVILSIHAQTNVCEMP